MQRVAFVCSTSWDAKQLAACRDAWEGRYEPWFPWPADAECPWDLEPVPYVERAAREWAGSVAGVTSSSDYPGATLAAAIAARLGLPGPTAEAVVRTSHKWYSRLAQREAAPEAVPRFDLIDPRDPATFEPSTGFPCFVKPVKGAFSLFARRVDSREELLEFLSRPAVLEFRTTYMRIFGEVVRGFTALEVDGDHFLAEGLLRGDQVTVEGWCHGDEVGILGVVDSVRHPENGSFLRFDYPSALPREVQERMADVARRVMRRAPLDHSLFNVEMAYDPATGDVRVIEVNPRMCGQFADLYAKVDGTSGYEVALALATGRRPDPRRGAGRFRCASSVPLRVFEPVRVLAAPDEDALRAVEAEHDGVLAWSECATGQGLVDFERGEDGRSARYAVINAGADSRAELLELLERVREELGFAFEPVAPAAPAG